MADTVSQLAQLLVLRNHHNDTHGNPSFCTAQTCRDSESMYNYRPSLVANGIFLGLFSFSLACYSIQGFWHRHAWGFSIAMVCGCFLEVLGYVGRVMAHYDPFTQNPFLLQICCLTIAPAFLAAGIYLCLSRIVIIFGRDISRIPPVGYTRLFIPCDIFSLVLQGTGGGMASVASQNNRDPKNGDNIMIAGLAFQVFTMSLFIVLAGEYGWRVLRRLREQGSAGLDPTHAKLRNSTAFKGFLAALSLATICIFTRCVFRVAELAGGWRGVLMKNQRLFIGLEGVMVIVAALALIAFHPGLCFKDGYEIDAEKKESRSGDASVE